MVAAESNGVLQPLRQPGTIKLYPLPVQYPRDDPFLRIEQGRGQKTVLAVAEFDNLAGAAGRPLPGIGIGDDPGVPQFEHPGCFGADDSCCFVVLHMTLPETILKTCCRNLPGRRESSRRRGRASARPLPGFPGRLWGCRGD